MHRLLTWIYKFCLFVSKENKRYCNIFTWSKLPHKYKRVRRFVEQKNSNTVKIGIVHKYMCMLKWARKINALKNLSKGV